MHSNQLPPESPFLLRKINLALLNHGGIFYHQWARNLFSALPPLKQLKHHQRQYQMGLQSDFPTAFISHFPWVWQENSLSEATPSLLPADDSSAQKWAGRLSWQPQVPIPTSLQGEAGPAALAGPQSAMELELNQEGSSISTLCRRAG